MTDGREVVLRRTWPQRLTALASLAVIVSSVVFARAVEHIQEVFESIERVRIVDTGQYGRELLRTDTNPGEPVNFLLVGTDSALGLDPNDPVMHNRVIDPTGRSLADTIILLRLDPVSGSAWVLSIPRDLWAEIPGAEDNRITSALYIGGAELLVATITSMFDVEINHYMELDLAGFRAVIDTLGGIPVWFPNPVRDPASGLDIAAAGCHLLDGERSLQYVRSRRYTEQIDGRWRITGGDDFSRIERQQDFLVLALDRAIDRGARNLWTMTNLVEAAVESVTLDQDLTPAELIELGQAFADFNPENLQRHRLDVYTKWAPDGSYQGETAYRDSNGPVLDVFRGLSDSVHPSKVTLRVVGADDADRLDAVTLLSSEGFDVVGSAESAAIPETVLMHGPDGRRAAMSVARYVAPVPYLVEREDLDEVVLVLGDDYWAINWLYQEPLPDVQAKVDARGVPPVVPDPTAALSSSPPVAGAAADGSDQPSAGDDRAPASETSVAEEADAPAEPVVVIAGRPPEGETCG